MGAKRAEWCFEGFFYYYHLIIINSSLGPGVFPKPGHASERGPFPLPRPDEGKVNSHSAWPQRARTVWVSAVSITSLLQGWKLESSLAQKQGWSSHKARLTLDRSLEQTIGRVTVSLGQAFRDPLKGHASPRFPDQ